MESSGPTLLSGDDAFGDFMILERGEEKSKKQNAVLGRSGKKKHISL